MIPRVAGDRTGIKRSFPAPTTQGPVVFGLDAASNIDVVASSDVATPAATEKAVELPGVERVSPAR